MVPQMNNGLCGVHKGWAIIRNFEWGPALLGPGWFGWNLPPHADGVRTSVFSTRREARKALKEVKDRGVFKITKVRVTITEDRGY